MLYIETSSGHVAIAGECLPFQLSKFASCDEGILTADCPVHLYRVRANKIDDVAFDVMHTHPNSITLIYSSVTYYALVLGREANWRIK